MTGSLSHEFLLIILGSTDGRAPKGFAPVAIGLTLTLIYLISIPVTNTSVNPARSTGVTLCAGGWATEQFWLFSVAPIAGAVMVALVYCFLGKEEKMPLTAEDQEDLGGGGNDSDDTPNPVSLRIFNRR